MNIYYVAGIPYSDELYHHGILGQKWGIRRYQNPDGSLTEAGKRRYNPNFGMQVRMPGSVNYDSKESIAKALNRLNIRRDVTAEYVDIFQSKIDRINREMSKIPVNSKKWLILQDKLKITEKQYVENMIENIGYLTMMEKLMNESKSRGYKVETKRLKGNYKKGEPIPFYYEVH